VLERPKISVVMPCLDQVAFVRSAILSVVAQKGDFDVECIVVDGGSTDGTLDVLESFGERIRWVSGRDGGQSDALNKGFAMASGEVLGWLNGDDLLAPGAMQRVADEFRRRPEVRWLYGKVKIIDRDGREIRRPITAYKNRRMRTFSYRRLLVENWISQMGVFWRRSAHDEVAPLRHDLHWAMDYDFWLRLGARWPGQFVDAYLAAFRWLPSSKSGSAFERQFAEELDVARRHAAGRYPREILLHRLYAARTVLVYRLLRRLSLWGSRHRGPSPARRRPSRL
jgi:glycosyltransferase involved in cell wall biosynthesis